MRSFFLITGIVPLLLCQSPAQAPEANARETTHYLDFQLEWHLITAGFAHLEVDRSATGGKIALDLESAGAVSRLYKVVDHYRVQIDGNACPSAMQLDALEGKRHVITRMNFDSVKHRLAYSAQDLVKNTTTQREMDVPPCTREILSGLMTLRGMSPEPGKTGTFTVTDGKKVVAVRVEAQAKDKVEAAGRQYTATRYEAFIFDNVLYKRRGRAFIWISDDTERLPVQLRFQMGFPVGNVSVQLQKYTRTSASE